MATYFVVYIAMSHQYPTGFVGLTASEMCMSSSELGMVTSSVPVQQKKSKVAIFRHVTLVSPSSAGTRFPMVFIW